MLKGRRPVDPVAKKLRSLALPAGRNATALAIDAKESLHLAAILPEKGDALRARAKLADELYGRVLFGHRRNAGGSV